MSEQPTPAPLAKPNPTPANIILVHNDLPDGVTFASGMAAIDTETTGLSLVHDRLCLCQVGDGQGNAWLIKFTPPPAGEPLTTRSPYHAPNLRALLENPRITKLFHYGRFDLAILQHHLGLEDIQPSFCTKIASKLAYPPIDGHGGKHNLRTLVRQHLGIELDKSEQLSNWAAEELTESQKAYAASDVLYLHKLYAALTEEVARKNRTHILSQSLKYLPTRVQMDLADLYPEADLFSHH